MADNTKIIKMLKKELPKFCEIDQARIRILIRKAEKTLSWQERLERLLYAKGLKKQELAKKLGITNASLSRILHTPDRVPTTRVKNKIEELENE